MMQITLMLLAFAAAVLLVFTLYPAIIRQTAGDGQSVPAALAAERRRTLFFSTLVFGIVLIGLLVADAAWWIIVSATLVTSLLFYYLMSKHNANRRKKREEYFENRMLDFLVLVCNNLRSGFALPNAIEIAAKSIGGILGEEFNIMLSEYRLGMELGLAVSRMNMRIRSENLQLFSSTVSIAIRTGSSISTVLERLIFTIRKRNEISDKLKAITAQFNFEALVMSFFPLLAFGICYLIAPKLMQPMLTTAVGWATIAGIIVLEFIGLQILKKICNVKL